MSGNDFGLGKPAAQVTSDVFGVYAVNAFPVVPVAGQPIIITPSGTITIGGTVSVSSVPAPADITVGGTISALNGNVSTGVMNGVATVVVLVTGTWVGTLSWLGSINSGAVTQAVGAFQSPTSAQTTTTTTNGTWILPCGGYQTVFAVMTAYTSGTAAINMRGSTAPFPLR